MHKNLKRALIGGAAIALLAGAGTYGRYYWLTGRFLEATDDAYLQADYTTIAPKVSGYIAAVDVEDNQDVKAGQVLARIDDSDFRTALDQAKADVATAKADITNIDAQLAQQQSVIAQAEAAIAADEAAVTFARQDSERYANLMRNAVASLQQAQQTSSILQQKSAALQRDRAGLTAAQQQVEVLKTARDKAATQLQHFEAIARQAELNLGYTTIVAPVDGTVGARSLRVGQYVQAGTQLMAVVPLQSVYVVGNFKETQLTDVRPGQPVEITVDTFPGVAIKGHVDSLAPASGQTFALLPPDNATGNFTKIVQRIPVKIVLEPGQALAGDLRPGMSVEPTIDTKATVLAARHQATKLAAR
ncbi:MAG: HlyD family secretion protein [Alphaproteobacteria bacterium]|nr:HlyD family secretion protein [Alphaproteobacteria bacterium]